MQQDRRRVLEVAPGGLTAGAAVAAMIVAALFLVFGIGFFIVVFGETPAGEDGLQLLQAGFAVIWMVACLAIIVFYGRVLATRPKTSPGALFQISETIDRSTDASPDFDERLRKLEGLHRDGLVSEAEYRRKRDEILAEKW